MSIFLPCMLIVVVNCPSPHDVVLVHGHRHHVHVVISGRSRGYIVCNAYYALNCVSFIGIPVWSISNGGPALPGLVQPKNLHSVCIASMNYKPAPVGFLKCYYACSTVLKAKKYDVSYHYWQRRTLRRHHSWELCHMCWTTGWDAVWRTLNFSFCALLQSYKCVPGPHQQQHKI